MIINGDCLDEMKKMEDNSISCIVTDPPYGLGFMGKEWDAGLPHNEIWKEALRIVKPGGHLLAFGGTRTYHRLTCAIEDSGWEIRDCLMWIYGSGFPKSHNHFGIEGYGTALKPAHEPIIMAMKSCDGTFKQNAEKWGQAGINIDACRIPTNQELGRPSSCNTLYKGGWKKIDVPNPKYGRWPANIILDDVAAALLDEQSGVSRSPAGIVKGAGRSGGIMGKTTEPHFQQGHNDSGGASRFFFKVEADKETPIESKRAIDTIKNISQETENELTRKDVSDTQRRFIYCAKTSRKERNEGLEGMPEVKCGMMEDDNYEIKTGSGNLRDTKRQNHHPTVKPLKLMRYLITLIMPPKDGILLDPFAGSGSTIIAAHQLGFKAIGIEKQPEYCEIARRRLENVQLIKSEISQPDLFDHVQEEKTTA